MKTIQSPDGVALLMENLWLRHKAGMKLRPCNVFMVELLPPTDEKLLGERVMRIVAKMNLKNSMAHGFNSNE